MNDFTLETVFNGLSEISNDFFFYYDLHTKTLHIPKSISKKAGLRESYSPMPEAFVNECVYENDKEKALAFFQNLSAETVQFRLNLSDKKNNWYAVSVCKGDTPDPCFLGCFRDIQNEIEQNRLKENFKVLSFVQKCLLIAVYNQDKGFQFLDHLATFFEAAQVFIALYDNNYLSVRYTSANLLPNHPQMINKEEMTFLLDQKYLKHTGHIEYLQNMQDFSNIHQFIGVPLVEKNGSTIGILGIVNGNLEKISETLLLSIANSVSLTMQNIAYHENLKMFSTYDLLTGVKNRNAYETYITEFVPTSLHTLGLIVVDINGLKACNDTAGHYAGDILIKTVSKALASVFGRDYVYRFGGDEFVVLCENISEEALENKIHMFELQLNNASVSLGYAYEKDHISIHNMQIKADKNMYISKEKYYQDKNNLSVRKN